MNTPKIDCILGLLIIICGLSTPFVILANLEAPAPVELARNWHD